MDIPKSKPELLIEKGTFCDPQRLKIGHILTEMIHRASSTESLKEAPFSPSS